MQPSNLVFLVTLFALLISTSLCASSATSFCKCTCKGNSTIIALNPPPSSSSTRPNIALRALLETSHQPQTRQVEAKAETEAEDGEGEETRKTHRASTCNDCNRKFCLDYNLPGCKGVREEEVFTTCFQRDSLKDEAIVFIFIFATAGLLIWALVKPWLEKWVVTARERRSSYVPLSGQDGEADVDTRTGDGMGSDGVDRERGRST